MGIKVGGIDTLLDPDVPLGTILMHPETLRWFMERFPAQVHFDSASDLSTQSRTGIPNGESDEAAQD